MSSDTGGGVLNGNGTGKQPKVFMALIRHDEIISDVPEMALKMELLFDIDYKPVEPRDPRTLVNALSQKSCTATVLAVHERIIACGTSSGLIVVSDPLGFVDHKANIHKLHARGVTALDIDSSGEFIASGGDDGRVVVIDLALGQTTRDPKILQLTHGQAIRSVALDPNFGRTKDRRILVACGGRVILYNSKKASFFSSSEPQMNVLVDGVVVILSLAWQPAVNSECQLLAWATERGDVILYDERRRSNAGLIRPETSQIVAATAKKTSASFTRVVISWLPDLESSNGSSILVACGSLLRIFRISGGDSPRNSDVVTPRVAHCTHRIPIGSDLVVGAVIASIDSNYAFNHAACCVRNDQLSYEFCLCALGDYDGSTTHLPQPSCYPIYHSNSSFVDIASLPYDRQTYILARNGALLSVRLSDINEEIMTDYVNYLLMIGDASAAAAQLPLIFDSKYSKNGYNRISERISWENWLQKFDEFDQLPAVAAYLPTNKSQADSAHSIPSKNRYDLVLTRVLKHSSSQFESLLSRLSPDLYSIDNILYHVSEALFKDPRNPHLLAALAFLYCSKKEYDRAVNCLLDLKHEALFRIVAENNLYGLLRKRVAELVACSENSDFIVEILMNHSQHFPSKSVISQLKACINSHPLAAMTLFKYLKGMFEDKPDELQETDVDLLVTLYADLSAKDLLHFLRSTDAYRLENALTECQRRKLSRETVYLLGKGGKMLEAIDVIIQELGSVEEAVRFCREKGGNSNRDLWLQLASRVVRHRPDLVAELLRLTGTELLDPGEVIKLIPTASGRLVPGLRQALESSLSDSERQLALLSAAQKVVGYDLNENYKQIHQSAFSAATVVDDRAMCQECLEPLSNSSSTSMRLLVFTCRHAFHYNCLARADEANCPVCGRLKEPSQPHSRPSSGQSRLNFVSNVPTGISQSNSGHHLPFGALLSGLAKR